ncbi:MAG TPA: methyl-accepting chemotaxis protein [Spirochaetota bacterium]|nr:methyl-accepting chemotaxis protein [Spirochaetota bacterium]
MKSPALKLNIRKKMIGYFLVFGILSSLLIILITWFYISHYETNKLRQNLQMIAQGAVELIDADAHSGLKPGDEVTETYTQLLRKLRKYKEISGLTYLYTISKVDEKKSQFILDTDESKDQAKIGKEYNNEPEMLRAYGGEVCSTEEPMTDEWGTFYTGFAPIRNSAGEIIGIVGADLAASDVEAMKTRLLRIFGIATILIMIISTLIAIVLSKKISSPIIMLADRLDDVVKNSGNLTQVIEIRTGDEIETLGNKINDLLSNIRSIVLGIKESSFTVLEATSDITRAIEESKRSSDAVNESMKDISVGAENQSATIKESTRMMERLSSYVDNLSVNSGQISTDASNASQYTEDAGKAVADLEEKSRASEELAEMVSETVSRLEEKSREVINIIGVISDISDQTNLLALNASIEAARAGEQGKGFAVVADEIRKLAESTNVSVKEISKHIDDVVAQSQETASAMNKVLSTLSGQVTSIENARTVLSKTISSIGSISGNIVQVDSAVKEVFSGKEEVLNLIKSVSSTSVTMAASTQEVSSITQEQHAITESILDQVNELNRTAEYMGSSVSRFKI